VVGAGTCYLIIFMIEQIPSSPRTILLSLCEVSVRSHLLAAHLLPVVSPSIAIVLLSLFFMFRSRDAIANVLFLFCMTAPLARALSGYRISFYGACCMLYVSSDFVLWPLINYRRRDLYDGMIFKVRRFLTASRCYTAKNTSVRIVS